MVRTLTAGATAAKAGPAYAIDYLVESPENGMHLSYTFNGTLLTDLIAFWKFEETTGARLDEINTNDLFPDAMVGRITGRVGSGVEFFSARFEYMDIPSTSTDLRPVSSDFTITAWVFLVSKTVTLGFPGVDRAVILGIHDADTSDIEYGITFHPASDRLIFEVSSDGLSPSSDEVVASTFGSPPLNTWIFVAAWIDTTANTINIRINDGTTDSAAFAVAVHSGSAPFQMGRGGTTGYGYYNGFVDATGIWLRILTASEQSELYNEDNGLEPPFWEQRIFSISEIETSVPPGGGLATISNITLQIADDGQGQSLTALRQARQVLHGKTLMMRLLFEGEAFDDAIGLFQGQIDAVSFRPIIGQLVGVDQSLPGDTVVPVSIVDKEVYPDAPDISINSRIPLIYGDSTTNIIPLLLVDTSNHEYIVTSHANQNMSSTIAVWLPDQDNDLGFQDETITTINAASNTITISTPITEQFFGEQSGTLTVDDSFNTANGAFAIDDDNTTHAELRTTDIAGLGSIRIKSSWPSLTTANIVRVEIEQSYNSAASTAIENRSFGRSLSADGSVRRTIFDTQQHLAISNQSWQWPVTHEEFRQGVTVTAEAILPGGLGTQDDDVFVSNITIEAAFQTDGPLVQLYTARLQGRIDDALGTITGTANALIENPIDVLHSAQNDLGHIIIFQTYADVKSILEQWKFHGGIGKGFFRQELSAREYLDSLAWQSGTYLYPDGSGNWKVSRYRTDPVIQFNFTQDHYLWATGGEDRAPRNRQPTFSVKPDPITNIYNHFEIRYNFHTGRQQFTEVAFANPDSDNHPSEDLAALCLASRNQVGDLPLFFRNADFISDTTTAEFLLSFLVNYFVTQRLIVEVEVPFVGIHLEVGDAVTFTHPILPEEDNGKSFEIIRLRDMLSLGRRRIVARRI